MKLLVDTDFLFGLVVDSDPHHRDSKRLGLKYGPISQLFALNLVIYETATVISYKDSHKNSLLFLEKLPTLHLSLLYLDNALEIKTWEIFKQQTKKGSSFVDCANLAAVDYYKLDGILSFDTAYPPELRKL